MAEQKEEDAAGSIGEDEIWGHLQKYRRQIESSSLENNTDDRMENTDLCKNTEVSKYSPKLKCFPTNETNCNLVSEGIQFLANSFPRDHNGGRNGSHHATQWIRPL